MKKPSLFRWLVSVSLYKLALMKVCGLLIAILVLLDVLSKYCLVLHVKTFPSLFSLNLNVMDFDINQYFICSIH